MAEAAEAAELELDPAEVAAEPEAAGEPQLAAPLRTGSEDDGLLVIRQPAQQPRSAARPTGGREGPGSGPGDRDMDLDEGEAETSGTDRQGRRQEPLLFEIAWEVCNQLGGIYTVLRSKAPMMVEKWGPQYFLVGPYKQSAAAVEFEPMAPTGPVGAVVKKMRELGYAAHFGRWLVTGRPHVVLLDYLDAFRYINEVKYRLWRDHDIGTPSDDELLNNVVAFGEVTRLFLSLMAQQLNGRRPMVAHFHEWMAGAAVPMLRKENWPGSTVFTTHATLLGRYLAMHDERFYDHLAFYKPDDEAAKFNVQAQYRIERAAAHGAHVFSTVSDVTGEECRHLLGREPDVLLPNGLNIQRFAALHEFQNMHRTYKEKIHEFTMGHFFPSYSFDLDKTLYFYTSGRYEYRNKGMDVTIEALARLNHWLRSAGSDITVVCFIITRQPVRSINVGALQSSAMLDEFRTITDAIKDQIGQRLFHAAAAHSIPDMNKLVDDYWLLRLRRTIQSWKREMPPAIVTHDLVDDQRDQVLNQLRACRLWNQRYDPVKVIYHPEFISSTNPLFGIEYDQFVRGCHLGVFPSYYEPWGYTPLESIALGVPAVTSDLSGFGSYLLQTLPDHQDKGVFVLKRRYTGWHESAQQLAQWMFDFAQLNRRQRISLRNNVETFAEHFDWHNLGTRYHEAHNLALQRIGARD